ncbi:hypothetical protein HIM_04579 [Hirsutella minnesotensis 3608]|uniref:Uncharacterized protein n=1 Tax=Hirsutella minnesotensis 3608 TaxID=1043627 RepID=A0A0F7ZV75_9HYPO|nr:hypothetical protein HIM_04579 [Hirsutella minnesotensis 3608]
MDRARRAAGPARRKPLPGSASPRSTPEASLDSLQSPSSPMMPSGINATTPQTAPQSRRGSRAAQHSFSFSTPGPTRNPPSKKRSRTMDGYGFGDEDAVDDGSPRKGGHSLRKRARVDYTLEHIDDDVLVPNSSFASASSRGKKRKSENTDASEDFYTAQPLKKRGNSLGADTSVRRNPARKSVEARAYKEEEDVKDTIEVGVSFSDLDESDPRRTSYSSNSSAPQSAEASWKVTSSDPGFQGISQHPHVSNPQIVDDSVNLFAQQLPFNQDSSQPLSPAQNTSRQSPRQYYSPSQAAPSLGDYTFNSTQDAQQSFSTVQESIGEIDPQLTQPLPMSSVENAPASQDEAAEQSQPTELPAAQSGVQPHEGYDSQLLAGSPINAEDRDQTGPITSVVDAPSNHIYDESSRYTAVTTGKTEIPQVEEMHQSQGNSQSMQDIDGSQEIEQITSQPPIITVSDTVAPSSSSSVPDPSELPAALDHVSNVPNTQLNESFSSQLSSDKPANQDSTETQLNSSHALQGMEERLCNTLSPYVSGEYELYPENRGEAEEEASGEAQTPDIKDSAPKVADKLDSLTEGDNVDVSAADLATPAGIGSPAPDSVNADSVDPTAVNSPALAAADEIAEDVDVTEVQESSGKQALYKYRKIRDPAAFVAALENYKEMSSEELYELLDVVNAAMRDWQSEFYRESTLVSDFENATKRREADAKYENKTRDLNIPGMNYEEPEFALKGFNGKQREKEGSALTRFQQSQDKIMSASYFFVYDPHPAKVGKQDLDNHDVEGVTTRLRTLRNHPKQSVKASEADEVTGKRARKPVQHFDPAPPQQPSRGGTPASTRASKKKNVFGKVGGIEHRLKNVSSKASAESMSEDEEVPQKERRRAHARAKEAVLKAAEESSPPSPEPTFDDDEPISGPGRRRSKKVIRKAKRGLDDDEQVEPAKQPRKRHVLTLKIPRGKNLSEPSSAITDNGDSRPSTSSSDSSSQTVESSYSFRPKRQERFRDEPDESEATEQPPLKKRGKRASVQGSALGKDGNLVEMTDGGADAETTDPPVVATGAPNRKISKIKVVSKSAVSRNGTPSSQPAAGVDGDDRPKDYKSMTKSEKMSASMKSRWANGNMAGAVEKRKATLAAKKAAQAAADQKAGSIAPKPAKIKAIKKEPNTQGQQSTQQHPRAGEFIQHQVPGTGSTSCTTN